MEKVKFTLTGNKSRTGNPPFATITILPSGRNFYCHLELNHKWEDFRRFISLNYWLEWDRSIDPPGLRLSRRAFADGLAAPRNSQQSEFGQFLPAILQKDPAGWRVVDYTQTAKNLQLTFAHASRTTDGEEDLVRIEIDFMHCLVCQADFN